MPNKYRYKVEKDHLPEVLLCKEDREFKFNVKFSKVYCNFAWMEERGTKPKRKKRKEKVCINCFLIRKSQH